MTTIQSCPRDATPVVRRLAGPVWFQVCQGCSGIWVSGDQLNLYLDSQVDAWNLPLDRPEDLPETFVEDTIRCPCSVSLMRLVERDGIHVDVCPDCASLWLDGGELAELMNKNPPDTYQGWPKVTPGGVLSDLADPWVLEVVGRFVLAALKRLPWMGG